MPQTTYLPLFRASYPILAPAQKPGGVTISTTLPPNAVPNEAVGPRGVKKAEHGDAARHKNRNHK